jgi:hypothetical protein
MRLHFELQAGEWLLAVTMVVGLSAMAGMVALGLSGLTEQDTEAAAYRKAAPCSDLSNAAEDCYQTYSATIARLGTMNGPGTDCAALLSSELGDEVASFDCGDTDVVRMGDTVTIKKWHGEIVEMAEPLGLTRYGAATDSAMTSVAASGAVLFGGLLGLVYLAGVALVIGSGFLAQGRKRVTEVSEDGLWWWDGVHWRPVSDVRQGRARRKMIRILLALLTVASVGCSIFVATGTAIAQATPALPTRPCVGSDTADDHCYRLVFGRVTEVVETGTCSVSLLSTSQPTNAGIPCSAVHLFTVGRYQSVRFWHGNPYWVSQGSDPTVFGDGITGRVLFILLLPAGLAALAALVLFAVQRFHPSPVPPLGIRPSGQLQSTT